MHPTRRTALLTIGAGGASLGAPAVLRARAATKTYRMLLNTAFSGPQAWLMLAQDNGYLRDEGLELEFTTGAGAFTAAPRMQAEGFDFGYGDVNSLIEVAAKSPDAAPVGVFMMFNASPSTIAVPASGPIRTPKDVEGKTLSGHATDVALRTFGAFCKSTGVDQRSVKIIHFDGSMRAQVEGVLASSTVHGAFGYVSTISAAMAAAKIDAGKALRFLKFADTAPDLYGSVVMASRKMMRDDPKAIAGLTRAVNRGLVAMLADIDASIEAVRRKDPTVTPEVEKLRLMTTLKVEMSHAEGRTLGIGAVDAARLARSIALVAQTNGLPRTPAGAEIFTDAYLPPLAERVTTLAS